MWQEWLQQQATTTRTTRTITTTSTAAATTSTTKATKGETEFSPAFETATFSQFRTCFFKFWAGFWQSFFLWIVGMMGFHGKKNTHHSWGDTRLDYYQCKSSYWRHGGRSGGHCNLSRRLRKCEFVALWEVKFAQEQNAISRWREIWIESLS